MSSQRKQQRAHRAEVQRVRAEMLGVRRELEQAYNEFDNITDPLLMEACIYEINALRAKYNCAVHDLKKSDTIGWFLMSQTLTDILVVIAAVFLVWLVIRLFRKPIRWILKLLLNTAIGFAALFLLNFFRQRHRHHARPQLDQCAGHRRGRVSGAGAAAAHQISLLAYINNSPHPRMRELLYPGVPVLCVSSGHVPASL